MDIMLTDETIIGGVRFDPGYYQITKLPGEPGPWWCGDCGEPVKGKFAPCPKCGPCKTSYGHIPF